MLHAVSLDMWHLSPALHAQGQQWHKLGRGSDKAPCVAAGAGFAEHCQALSAYHLV